MRWQGCASGKRGRSPTYSETAIQFCLTIKSLFDLEGKEAPRTSGALANASDDVREASSSYGLGHYTIKAIADVPVQFGNQCYVGHLQDWFGGYAPKSGLEAQLCMRIPWDREAPEVCYVAGGLRHILGITTSVVPFSAM